MKTRLIWHARVFAVLCLVAGGRPALADQAMLEDSSMRVAFDRDSGALSRLENKTTHWVIERRPDLGVAFRLFAPLPGRRWNPVLGQKQHAAEVKKISDHEMFIQWRNLDSENGGVLPMTLTSVVTLTNGALTFNARLENNSALTVETLDYPYLGDLSAPTRDALMEMRVMTKNRPGNLKMDEIHPHFSNEKGYWGVFWPLKTREAQQSRFCLISATNEGLCVEAPVTPYQLQWTFEQHPGVISGINNLVPPGDEISGAPVHLEFRACHFIFAGPHSTTNITPVVLRSYRGDWHAGVARDKP